jgi:probable HAF family extracellular repeat protein
LIDLHSSVDQETGAWGVNGLGEVAGFRRNSTVDRAVYWNQNGVMQDIGTLGGAEATALSINDAGKVVGWAYTGGRKSVSHGFVWHSSTGMRDLNALKSLTETSDFELTSASKINNAGQILAEEQAKLSAAKSFF